MLIVIGGVLAAVLLGGAGVAVVDATRAAPLPRSEVRRYLDAWASGAPSVDALSVKGAGAAADQKRFRSDLGITASSLTLTALRTQGDHVVAAVAATHTLRGLGEWKVESSLAFVHRGDRWLADWKPSALHPHAAAGDHFERDRTRPARAPILGESGVSLTPQVPVVLVGVEPRRVTDHDALATALQQTLGIDPARLDAALAAPGVQPDHFVQVAQLRDDRYQQVKPVLYPIPGVEFQRKDMRLPLDDVFAAQTLGRTGEITAELLDKLGPLYQVGDTVGLSGLELAHERELAGTPSGRIRLVTSTGAEEVLQSFTGVAPTPVTTTLRPDVQRAADAALDGVTVPAALVALDAGTGAVLAVSSRPLAEPLNRALDGHYPPGSTFKIVTTDALISARGADEQLTCPTQVVIGGKPFRNFENEALGALSLRDAFVHSCNTAFASAASTLPDDALVAAAARYGFGVKYATSGASAEGGAFPPPHDAAERAAAAIGQGRVLATPVHMASVAAAATTGTWHAPYLLPAQRSTATASPTPAAIGPLGDFMRGVVTEGTASATANVPDLIGKTGTAEFGPGDPPATHAWFVGSRHGVAFAVILEGGGVGGRDAGPVAARFATATG